MNDAAAEAGAPASAKPAGRPPRAAWPAWKVTIIALAGSLVIRLLAVTWRVRVRHGDVITTLRAKKQPFIYVLWHGQMLPLFYHHRGEGTFAMVSEHRDGELITRVIGFFGLRTVRGSTSRGGERALLHAVQVLKQGNDVSVTTDGPRGPRQVFAPGALIAAQRSGAPIVPVGASANRAWRLRSWDRFMIPKPFARVTIAYGPATFVEAGSPREAAAEVPRFQALLEAAVARAEE